MSRMIKILFFVVYLSSLFSLACAQSGFEKVLGGTADDLASAFCHTADSGYLLGGATLSFGNYVQGILWKLQASGNTQWANVYGNNQFDRVCSVMQTYDGNYIATGTAVDTPNINTDAWLFKTDATGNVLWSKLYGNAGNDYVSSLKGIVQTTDSGFAFVGGTDYAGGTSNVDFFVVRTNALGDTLWTKVFRAVYNDQASSIIQTSDGGFLVCGRSNSNPSLVMDVFLIKLNAAGSVQWAKRYGDAVWDESTSLIQTADLGFAVCGSTTSFGPGDYNGLIFKTDSIGNLQWTTVAGNAAGADALYGLVETDDGSIVSAGFAEGYSVHRYSNSSLMGNDSADVWMIKLTASGDTVWNYLYGGYRLDEGYSLQKHPDGGFLTAAYTQSFTSDNSWQVYIIKTDSLGIACTGIPVFPDVLHPPLTVDTLSFIQLNDITVKNYPVLGNAVSPADSLFCFSFTSLQQPTSANDAEILPNPFVNSFHIHSSDNNLISKATIFNSMGKDVTELFVQLHQPGDNITFIAKSSLSRGIYFLNIVSNKKIIKTYKLIHL